MDNPTTSSKQPFAGDKKNLIHFLAPYEKRLIAVLVPRVPKQISTVHLTLMTILWSFGVGYSGYLARLDIQWLWLFSACILLQHITDMLDGAVGRARNTGLIKWGFYMDHFLDYIFLSSILIGYSFLLPKTFFLLTLLSLALTAGFMVHVLMDFSITNNFKISVNYFGVSEMRWVLIIFNIALIIFGKTLLVQVFPFYVGATFLALCVMVFKSQKIYRHLDAIKQSQQELVKKTEEKKEGV